MEEAEILPLTNMSANAPIQGPSAQHRHGRAPPAPIGYSPQPAPHGAGSLGHWAVRKDGGARPASLARRARGAGAGPRRGREARPSLIGGERWLWPGACLRKYKEVLNKPR